MIELTSRTVIQVASGYLIEPGLPASVDYTIMEFLIGEKSSFLLQFPYKKIAKLIPNAFRYIWKNIPGE